MKLTHFALDVKIFCQVITKVKSRRIAKFAFDYAIKHNRKKVANFQISKIIFSSIVGDLCPQGKYHEAW